MMPVAPDSAIEAALVHIVEKRLGAGDHELLTLKRVRATAEEELELPPDYLKNHSTWKERSKKIVTDEVARLEKEDGEQDSPGAAKPTSKVATASPKKARVSGEPSSTNGQKASPKKRKPPAATKAKERPRKRQKQSESEGETSVSPSTKEEDNEDDYGEEAFSSTGKTSAKPSLSNSKAKTPRTQSQKKKKMNVVESELESEDDAKPKSRQRKPPPNKNDVIDSESESGNISEAEARRKPLKSKPEVSSADQQQKSPQTKKKRKGASSDSESGPEAEAEHEAPVEKPSKDEDPITDQIGSGNSTKPSPTLIKVPYDANAEESPLSSPIDEPQPSRKKQKSANSSENKSKSRSKPSKSAKPKKSSGASTDLSPAQEEIKRLQSQLLKCGIRKMWVRELGKFDSDKDKVRHLREMLKEAGMEGRFSEEKARQIKEERELAKELEAIKEGEKGWGRGERDGEGQDEGADGAGGARKRRNRVPLALQELEFDDEED